LAIPLQHKIQRGHKTKNLAGLKAETKQGALERLVCKRKNIF